MKTFLRKTLKVLKVLLLTVMIFSVMMIGVIAGSLFGYVENVEVIDISRLTMNLTTFVYADDGSGNKIVMDSLYEDENRVWASIDEIPKNLQNAFVAIEDERFYSHSGFDIKRIIGAGILYIQNKLTGSTDSGYGASTITQQFIKNVTGEDDVTLKRKIQEIYRAYKLEKDIGDKDKILELYLNTIYLSQQCNGVRSAAARYFGKQLSELTLAECACIAAITKYPTKYDPILNPEDNAERRAVVLAKMLECGYIDKAQYDAAVSETLSIISEDSVSSKTTSYYVDAVIDQVLDDLVKIGYTKSMANRLLYSGGLTINAAVDIRIQGILEDYYTGSDHFPKGSGSEQPESAMIIIDHTNGQIKALVGGRGDKTAARTLNRATQTLRQPGSSIKPLAIYAPAIEYGKITPSSMVSDSPITIQGWSPRNDDRAFLGNITVRRALAGSRNVPAVRILRNLGLDRSYSFLTKNFHITSLVRNEVRGDASFTDKAFAAIGLGGLTDGVSLKEMAAAYVPFAQKGIYYTPTTYTSVLDSQGNVLLQADTAGQVAMSEKTAYLMTDMLEDVVSYGTGTSARLSGIPAAGKTGTTSSNYDRWFVGYTPYYVGAVWFGYDTPKSLRGFSGNPSARVWKAVMTSVHEGYEKKSFNTLGSTVSVMLCADSRQLPNSTCTEFVSEIFNANNVPKSRCSLHLELDDGEGKLVEYTPPTENEAPSEVPDYMEPGDGNVIPIPQETPNITVTAPTPGPVTTLPQDTSVPQVSEGGL
ncbi:MAG: PBP1A family penicillin-binding protein [Clostridia bacterium]|nr:PBP1A family penicillin-binding protein [Clostridia bacterium]